MNQQEIIEYNKRCAEFLGLKRGWWISQQKPLTEDKRQWWDIDGKTFLGTKVYYDKDLQFQSEWNWIMEVVEAIEKLKFNVEIVSYHGNNPLNYCSIHKTIDEDINEIESIISPIESNDKKEAVVEAINQFLIWYNELH